MTIRNLLTGFIALQAGLMAWGQQSAFLIAQDDYYETAMAYYEKGNYGTAKEFFLKAAGNEGYDKNSEIRARSAFNAAMCAISLFHDDAEYLTNKFIGEYGYHALVNEARFQLANYFYASKKYNNALEYYHAVDRQKLTAEKLSEYHFKKGYCYFVKDDFDNARTAFYEILGAGSKYTSPAIYYYAHINYSQKNYQTALNNFLKLTGDETFGAIVPYYITQVYFLQKDYKKVIEFAPGFMEKVTEKRVAEVARMIGESYMQTGKYAEAIPYLEKYMEKADYVTKEDKYQAAYAYYKSERYEEAAEMFGKLSGGSSLLCQNAFYHLADCYLKLDRKHDARMAFASAAKMDYDKHVQEDAAFNYAVVTYELSYVPFNEAITALNDYIKKYPSSRRSDEAYNYLVQAYLTAKNYKMALESIEKITDKSPEIKKAYQRIAFYRALELIKNLNYKEAITLLNNSTMYGAFDADLGLLADYWKAEAWYKLGDYTQAVANYIAYVGKPGAYRQREYNLALYGIGYANFQQKKYAEAAEYFRKYVTEMNNAKVNTVGDALNRTGDCFFIRKDYYAAIDFYDRGIANETSDVDYAMFQKGLSLGVLNKEEDKITVLNNLLSSYPASNYADDALYEMGVGYVALNNPENAVTNYRQIVEKYPNSSYVPRALVNMGLIYYNSSRYNEALSVYKQVIKDYPGSDEAKGALAGIKNVYIEQGNVDGYFEFTKTLGTFAQVSTREQDSLSYISAENLYMTGDCEKSSQSFKRYIENFPDGSFILNAHFYKGDCNYQLKQYDEALKSFDFVISKPKNNYTEQALLGAARISYNNKNYKNALEYYSKLAVFTETRANMLEARIGQMRCNYFLEDHNKVIESASLVLETDKLSESLEREARFKMAKALLANNRPMLALEEFQKVAGEVSSIEGAESKYRVAEIYFKRGELQEADKIIAGFAEKTTPHQYWMAMSFILWADIYATQNDYFQAIQTLQSIIDYYGNSSDGILDLARTKHKQYSDKQQADEKVVEQKDIEINIEQ
ncbi:MAG: tetratricopeptide repeat protein [Bacteroidales bacterium]|nr:tetratricopeptide repeat protein [Bacteroidales bacterium]